MPAKFIENGNTSPILKELIFLGVMHGMADNKDSVVSVVEKISKMYQSSLKL